MEGALSHIWADTMVESEQQAYREGVKAGTPAHQPTRWAFEEDGMTATPPDVRRFGQTGAPARGADEDGYCLS
jgi:hypothetical protein